MASVYSIAGPLIPHAISSLQGNKWRLQAINSSFRKARCLRKGIVLRGDPVPRIVKERTGTETGTGEGVVLKHPRQREGMRILEICFKGLVIISAALKGRHRCLLTPGDESTGTRNSSDKDQKRLTTRGLYRT